MGIWRFAGAFAVVERQSECGSKNPPIARQPANDHRRVLPAGRSVILLVSCFNLYRVCFIFHGVYFLLYGRYFLFHGVYILFYEAYFLFYGRYFLFYEAYFLFYGRYFLLYEDCFYFYGRYFFFYEAYFLFYGGYLLFVGVICKTAVACLTTAVCFNGLLVAYCEI